ncbi:MAG: hypothetical protein JNK05_30600 [Myxococcales bacterium]|nr:hypothetical protein [Myxococcales bacterium]
MKLTVPRALAVSIVAAGAAAASVAFVTSFEACTTCPPLDACYRDLVQNPDGGAPISCYRRALPDGGATCTSEPCPAVPEGCPVA